MLDKNFQNILQAKINPEIWSYASDSSHLFDIQWERVIKREYNKATSTDRTLHIPFDEDQVLPQDCKPMVRVTR